MTSAFPLSLGVEREHDIHTGSPAPEELETAPWLQASGETNEAYAAFCVYLDLGPRRSIDAAYRTYLSRTRSRPISDVTLRACGRWTCWSVVHRWRERALAFDRRNQRIVHQSRDWLKGHLGVCWYLEQQEDIRERLEIYRNLRRGLLALTAGGLVVDTSTKRAGQTEEGGWVSDQERVRVADQFRIMKQLRESLFPADDMMVTDEYGNQWSKFTPPEHILIEGEQEADSAAMGAAGDQQ